MINKFKEKLKHHFHEVHKPEIPEHSIALGFAIGTFIGIFLPIPILSIPLALLIILFNKKISKLALFGAILFWNFLTLPPVYLLSYKIGKLLFNEVDVVKFNIVILDRIYNFSREFLIGNFILAVLISVASYFIVKKIVYLIRKRKLKSIKKK